MKSTTARILAAVALVVLIAVANEMTYRDEVRDDDAGWHRLAPEARAWPLCREPDADTEIRVVMKWCHDGRCQEICTLHPFNPDESPRETMQRLLKRERIQS